MALLTVEVNNHLASEGINLLHLAKTPRLAIHISARLECQQHRQTTHDCRSESRVQTNRVHQQLVSIRRGATTHEVAHLVQIKARQLSVIGIIKSNAIHGASQRFLFSQRFDEHRESLECSLGIISQLCTNQSGNGGDINGLCFEQILDLHLKFFSVHRTCP